MSEECTAKNMLVKIADAVFNMRPLNYKQGASFEAPYIHSFLFSVVCSDSVAPSAPFLSFIFDIFRILDQMNASATKTSSGIVCHSLDTTDTTIASLCGIIRHNPATMIPSRTPSPDGANIARMPIIAETPQIPAQNSSSEYSTAG